MQKLKSRFLSKENWSRRLIELVILVVHLLLLYWIVYILSEGGVLPIEILVAHFVGIAATGALLIRFCAWLYHRQYIKDKGPREHGA